MKLLMLDIETSPNTAHIWGLRDQYISPDHLLESSYVLCWAAKWYGSKEVMFSSVQDTKPKFMLRKIHDLISEADAVCHYNGTRFDIPVLNKEFLLHHLAPPAPYSLGTYIGSHVHMEPFSMYTWNLSPLACKPHNHTFWFAHCLQNVYIFALGSAFRASQVERVNPNNNL